MPEYTLIALCSVIAVVGLELLWLRTGMFRTAQFWISMLIVWGFQVPVDGWLTKAEGTIVGYDPDQIIGLRVGWNSPIEDFAFGFSMVTLTLLVWHRVTRTPAEEETARSSEGA